MKKFLLFLIWSPVVIGIVYMFYVGLTGTGYEANGLEHFVNSFRGISVELGSCDKLRPDSLQVAQASTISRSTLKPKALMATHFEEGDKVFYLFSRSLSDEQWTVHAKPKSDYRGIFPIPGAEKIWLSKINEYPLGAFHVVAARTQEEKEKLTDGERLISLPKSLKYSQVFKIK